MKEIKIFFNSNSNISLFSFSTSLIIINILFIIFGMIYLDYFLIKETEFGEWCIVFLVYLIIFTLFFYAVSITYKQLRFKRFILHYKYKEIGSNLLLFFIKIISIHLILNIVFYSIFLDLNDVFNLRILYYFLIFPIIIYFTMSLDRFFRALNNIIDDGDGEKSKSFFIKSLNNSDSLLIFYIDQNNSILELDIYNDRNYIINSNDITLNRMDSIFIQRNKIANLYAVLYYCGENNKEIINLSDEDIDLINILNY